MSNQIPDEYVDLLQRPVVVSLVTQNPDGFPQVTPVWCSYDGELIWVNTEFSRRKAQNMRDNPRVAILALDPDNAYRYLEVRGEIAEETTDGALEHINQLSMMYFGRDDYYQNMPERRGNETRVIFKIRPVTVNAS